MTGGPQRIGKILVAVTEDWFAASHFLPLLRFLKTRAETVVLLTSVQAHRAILEAEGIVVRDFDFQRSEFSLWHQPKIANAFRQVVREEAPDLVHAVAMKPVALACLLLPRPPAVVLHVTGLGHLANSRSPLMRMARIGIYGTMQTLLRGKRTHLIVENSDDAAEFRRLPMLAPEKVSLVPGAGLPHSEIPNAVADWPGDDTVRCVYAGRMIASKGVEILIEAVRLAVERGCDVRLDLFGDVDKGNPEALSAEKMDGWVEKHSWLRWYGRVEDRDTIWKPPGIAVQPTLKREGMPRSLLEAAAHGHALIATDIPGSRDFVSDGVEGQLVPPGDTTALADAICALMDDPAGTRELITHARRKVVDEFSEDALAARLNDVYDAL